MEYPIRPLHHFSNFSHQIPTADWYSASAVDLARLRHEREILETGLANCVTYLHVLRKKQARNDRLLNFDPLPPRKKRKKIQQNRRDLNREIKNRERDEQAFFHNLQFCKANMYMAGGSYYTPTELSSTLPDCASTATISYEAPEPMEISWRGWTDDAATSPFARQHTGVGITKEFAPDELNEISEEGDTAVGSGKIPRPQLQSATTDTTYAHYLTSSLSHDATTFLPSKEQPSLGPPPPENRTDKLHNLLWLDDKVLEAETTRGPREAGICTSMQALTIDPRPKPERRSNGTWYTTSPQQSSHKTGGRAPLGRARTNSL